MEDSGEGTGREAGNVQTVPASDLRCPLPDFGLYSADRIDIIKECF